MNWLEKLSQKQMPLPFPDHDLEGGEGIRIVHNKMTQEMADQEREQHPGIGYWSAGNAGLVADIGEKVIKYSLSPYEYANAQKVKERREQGSPIQCVPQVYDVQKFPNGLIKVVFEKVTPLNKPVESFQDANISDAMFAYVDSEEFQNEKQEMEACLTINHIPSGDSHISNLGRNSKGRLVLLDIG